jgi:hypothetical protein
MTSISLYIGSLHIENTSVGKLPIQGDTRADRLARLALDQKDPPQKGITLFRLEILVQSAQLIANIDQLLTNHPRTHTTGGTFDSSHDFSDADALLLAFRDFFSFLFKDEK